MSNIDEHGNKIAAKKEKKTIVSQRIRDRRIAKAEQFAFDSRSEKPNPKVCGICGHRFREEGHSKGASHNGTVSPCHRGR